MDDLKTLQRKLAQARAAAQKLEEEIQQVRRNALTALPSKVGLTTVDELIKALVAYASPRFKGQLNGQTPEIPRVAPSVVKKKTRKKRSRATITEEIRTGVIAAAKAGKMTRNQIAEKFGISGPSVANIKKAAKLTQPRGKK